MNKDTYYGAEVKLKAMLGVSPAGNRYLMLLIGLPTTPWDSTGWSAVETGFTGYSRPLITGKLGNWGPVGVAYQCENTSEIRITASGATAAPLRAYAVTNSASGAPQYVYCYGLFDKDITLTTNQDFVIPVGGLQFREV